MEPPSDEIPLAAWIVNRHGAERQAFLEPWCEECPIAPGGRVLVVGYGPRSDAFEFEEAGAYLTIWWNGSIAYLVPAAAAIDEIDPEHRDLKELARAWLAGPS